MHPFDYIEHETKRQSGTAREAVGMYAAWLNAQQEYVDSGGMDAETLCHWAYLINGSEGYRNTPVYFRSGGHAVNHVSIPRAMEALVEAIADSDSESYLQTYAGYSVGFKREDYLTKEFLDIHPFLDGNGRVGSLLWNYLRGSIHDPEPMPYFYGDA